MPEAIATTKRKFYKALDALNNPPTATTRSAAEPASKRVRRSISTTSSIVQRLPASTVPKQNGQIDREPPNFSPWSHEKFLARLQTFSSVSQWHPKPDAISEVEWAKRGWVCVDVNTVACKGGCEKRVVVSLGKKFGRRQASDDKDGTEHHEGEGEEHDRDDEDEAALEALLAERYKAEIVEGHADNCLWRKAGCKDDVYRLPVVRPSVWQPELRNRYQSLLKLDDALRNVKVKTLPHDSSNSLPPEKLLDELPADIIGLTSVLDERAKALEIALHGWRGSSASGNDLLHCDACFQRVGLWMYQPGYKPSRTSSDDSSEDVTTAQLDLLELHRDHCPWRNAEIQNASGTLAGLNASQILQRVVSTSAREQRRRSDEQVKATQPPQSDVADAEDAPDNNAEVVSLSRVEIEKQDKERESRLFKLKKLFTIKRRTPKAAVKANK